MPLNLVVPKEDQTDDCFRFTLVKDGKTTEHTGIHKRLEENTMTNLRILAKKVGLSGTGYMKKDRLARELQACVFFNTHEEAAAAWPILDEPLEATLRGLTLQRYDIGQLVATQPYTHFAHFCKKMEEVNAALRTAQMEAERERQREKGKEPPKWWAAGDFVKEEDWNPSNWTTPYLKVVVDVVERSHDGYCSGIEEDDDGHFIHFGGGDVITEETNYKMIGRVPLKDKRGGAWNFLGPSFDPRWRCASGGSGVCGVRPSVSFVSMERIV